MTWVVPKYAGKMGKKKLRMVTDFRPLNGTTIGDRYPLQITTDIIGSITTAAFLSALDLKTGVFQFNMHS